MSHYELRALLSRDAALQAIRQRINSLSKSCNHFVACVTGRCSTASKYQNRRIATMFGILNSALAWREVSNSLVGELALG
jgi:hypothetical protein